MTLHIVPGRDNYGWPGTPMLPDPELVHEHEEYDTSRNELIAKLEQADDMTPEQAENLVRRFEDATFEYSSVEWRNCIARAIAHMPGMTPMLWMLFEHVMADRCDCFREDSDVKRWRDHCFADPRQDVEP